MHVIMISCPPAHCEGQWCGGYRYQRPLYGHLHTKIKGHQTLPHTLSREKSQALFATELSLLPFDMVFSAQDVEDKLHLFNQLFINTLNSHAPVKHTIIKGRSQSFINKDIKLLMNRRDKMLKVFRATHNMDRTIG